MNFKRYIESSDTWVDSHYIRGTSTDTLTLPQTIYGDGTNASLTIKGNTTQSGTPSPSNPVDVVGCGDLETSGEHAGQYKIPILNGGVTTNVYLGEVQTVRQIKKLVLTGQENWTVRGGSPSNVFFFQKNDTNIIPSAELCTHYLNQDTGTFDDLQDKHILIRLAASNDKINIGVRDSDYPSTNTGVGQYKQWLQQQYSNGTPVVVYYALATAETTTVNEPLQKLSNYADSLTTSIPTTDGANSLSIGTTVQPSEVTANYHGWHPVADTHERENGAWT